MEKHMKGMTTSQSDDTVSRGILDEKRERQLQSFLGSADLRYSGIRDDVTETRRAVRRQRQVRVHMAKTPSLQLDHINPNPSPQTKL